MRMYDVILKKRRGQELTKKEIEYFVDGFTKGEIPDYQASALLMAIFFNSLNKEETSNLTMAMVNSGETISLDNIKGKKVDKHSTGGVGDTTTILLAPMVASCGVPVAKMSGRGLGHTGGTIDKLESFKNFSVELSEEEFIRNVNDINIAVIAQSANLVPADKKLYALRDVTATVDNIPLIASSIMSKKIASGADGIVLDVKVGDGAFMKTYKEARELANEMVEIGRNLGRHTVAVISDMDQPLGFAIGNALEVIEAINTLKGEGPEDLLELALTLGGNMLLLAGKVKTFEEGKKMLLENIRNGKALEKLKEFIKAQGGDEKYVDDISLFPKAKYVLEAKSSCNGIVNKINSENLGIIAMELGAGRKTKESVIDLAVGIVLEKKRGDKVSQGDCIAKIYANDKEKGEKALLDVIKNYSIEECTKGAVPLIYDIVR